MHRYLLPRPLRLSLSLFGAISCLVATIISGTQLVSVSNFSCSSTPQFKQCCSVLHVLSSAVQQAIKYHEGTPQYSTVAINLAGCLAFGALFFVDRNAADARVSRREKVCRWGHRHALQGLMQLQPRAQHAKSAVGATPVQVRKAQISIGDREVVLNEGGERVSRLKEVDSDWIIRRLERWGQKVRSTGCMHTKHCSSHMLSINQQAFQSNAAAGCQACRKKTLGTAC